MLSVFLLNLLSQVCWPPPPAKVNYYLMFLLFHVTKLHALHGVFFFLQNQKTCIIYPEINSKDITPAIPPPRKLIWLILTLKCIFKTEKLWICLILSNRQYEFAHQYVRVKMCFIVLLIHLYSIYGLVN